MKTTTLPIEMMQAQDLPTAPEGAAVPDWIQLLPAGTEVSTVDNRGPYRVVDPQAVVAASAGRSLPIDENHAIDIKGPRGESTPAVGRIVELEVRADGSIWGRADWNQTGRQLMSERAYIGISPVITVGAGKAITGILRASLTNKPNLRGMTALNMEIDSMNLAAIAKALGLPETASEDQILAAIAALQKPSPDATALQTQLSQIGVALGISQDAAPDAILAAARSKPVGSAPEVVALQAELATVTTELNALKEDGARAKATGFVDGAIKEGRVGVKPLRDHYIAMHMQDAARVEKEIGAMPVLNGTTVIPAKDAAATEGEVALQSAHVEAAKALGMDLKTYAAGLKADNEEAL